jgi:hypothetical protein
VATIQNAIQLFDGMSPVLKKIANATNIVISSLEEMAKVSSQPFDTARLYDARRQLNEAETEMNQIDEAIEQARKGEEKLNQSMAQGTKEAHGLKETWEKISGTLGMAGIAVGAKEILTGANDKRAAGNTLQAQTGMQGDTLEVAKQSMTNLYTDNMGESLEDVAQSMSKVYQITGQTGVGLEQMTRAGILLRDTFGYEVTESMRTAEMIQKQFGVSGAQAFDMIIQGAQAGLDKNGDLLDTINEYSVQFKKLGFDSTDMFNMLINGAQSGTFSVDKLGDAIKEFSIRAIDGSKTTQEGFKAIGLDANKMAIAFGQGGDVAKQAFQQTMDAISRMEDPVQRNIAGVNLFGTMWEDLGYEGVMALANLNGSVDLTTQNLEDLNNVKYDDATSALASLGRTINMGLSGVVGSVVNVVTRHMSDFTAGLQGDASQIQGIFGGIGLAVGIIGRAISGNWSIIEPIMWGILGILGTYLLYIGYVNAAEAAGLVIKGAIAIANGIHALAIWATTSATWAQTTAQLGLNGAMYACPIVWIIGLIIALIAVFYAVVAWINKIKDTSVSATGIICAAFAFAGTVIWNTVIGVLNAIIQSAWSTFVEPFIGIIEWVLNATNGGFDSFGGAVANLIGQIISWFLSLGKVVTQIIDAIFGTDWTSGLSSLQDSVISWGKSNTAITIDRNAPELNGRIAYSDAINVGYQFGQGIDKKVSGVFDGINNPFDGVGGAQDTWDGIHNNTGDTAGNTAAMADSMDVLDEDLKYMRDAAEQEVINRFTLAELKVDVKNSNTLTKKTDFDDMGRALSMFTSEFLASAAEGGHI